MASLAPVGGGYSIASQFKRFDVFPKTLEDFRVKTTSGAAVSIVSILVLTILFISEFAFYLSTDMRHEMIVDTENALKELRINIDITFPKMPCSYLSLDAMDISGSTQLDVVLNVYKRRLDSDGKLVDEGAEKEVLGGQEVVERPANYCGSCYGSEEVPGQCCNTCDEVRESYRKKGWGFSGTENIEQCQNEGFTDKLKTQKGEGCHISGHIGVSRVAGNFHFAPGKSFQQNHMHVHDLLPFQMNDFNMTHTINRLSFGEDFPGVLNPIDGVGKTSKKKGEAIMYQYFVKVVPTEYVHLNGDVTETNQYSYTEHQRAIVPGRGHGLPGVFVMYDINPIRVKITEARRSFLHFLTTVCAIIGGIFTVSGIIDSLIYHSMKSLKKKMELGKAW